jgi:hypothetical protein
MVPIIRFDSRDSDAQDVSFLLVARRDPILYDENVIYAKDMLLLSLQKVFLLELGVATSSSHCSPLAWQERFPLATASYLSPST